MASGILGIALTGLNAAQAGIRTTEHNIANVNTAGYRRQEVDYAALQPLYSGAGYFGNGVGVESVRSLYSQFLDNEVLLSQTQVSKYESFTSGATQIDKMLGDSGSGLSTALDSFFSAVSELANDPTSGVARQVVLSAGSNLAGRINTLDSQLRNFVTSSNSEIVSIVGQVNLYASQIASLNNEIARTEAANGGQPANDLRDQRQQMLGELNKLVNVSLVQQSDGSTSVFIGSGQPLVVGNKAYSLSTTLDPDNAMLRMPTLDLGGTDLTLTSDLVTGGKLGGVLALRDQVVLPAFNDLNRIAMAIGAEVNQVHRGGLDYDLNAGGDFFKNPVVPQGSTTGQLQMTITNDTLMDPRGYGISLTGAGYVVTAQSTGTSTTYANLAAVNAAGLGFSLAAGTPAPAAGMSWNIGDYARQMRVALTSATQVAAAGNTADGPGDNANALALGALRFSAILGNGTATFSAAYNQTIGRTASLASEADLNLSAYTSMSSSAEAASRSVSGVNLDEEAVNLIRFQQAYQAAAKAIQVASSMFNEILGIVR
jgi:flagellar hook-associated protein 1 FlgK